MTEVINAQWILDHLPRHHGAKAELADSIGMDRDKLTKVLKGLRRLTVEEAARIADHLTNNPAPQFIEPQPPQDLGGFSEDDVQPLANRRSPAGNALQTASRALAPSARHRSLTVANRDLPGFSIARGDFLVLDLNAEPRQGDLVIAQVYDSDRGHAVSLIRQFLPPLLVTRDGNADHGIYSHADPRLRIAAVILALFRAPQLAE